MPGQQFNLPLDERYSVALKQLTARDDISVPELLRPVVEQFLDQELQQDEDLTIAVDALLRARTRAKSRKATVTQLPTGRERPNPGTR